MIHIEWSSRAEEDFNSIFDYIAEENPAAAVRQTDLILEAVQQLRRFAESGMRSIIRRNRKLAVPRTPYAIYYRFKHERIELTAIRHGAKRPLKRL